MHTVSTATVPATKSTDDVPSCVCALSSNAPNGEHVCGWRCLPPSRLSLKLPQGPQRPLSTSCRALGAAVPLAVASGWAVLQHMVPCWCAIKRGMGGLGRWGAAPHLDHAPMFSMCGCVPSASY